MEIEFDLTDYRVQMFGRNYLDITDETDAIVCHIAGKLALAGWFVKVTEHNGRKYLRWGA